MRLNRPLKFADYAPQPALEELRTFARHGKLEGVFLFAGPYGTGKSSAALTVALARQCLNFSDAGDICGTCEKCAPFFSGKSGSIDILRTVHPKDVERSSDIVEHVNYASQIPALLVDEVHGFDAEIHDALLQLLDIPRDNSLIILATTQLDGIPRALKSRCDIFHFGLISDNDLAEVLIRLAADVGITLGSNGALEIARTAEGHARDAVRMVERLARSMAPHSRIIEDEMVHERLGASDLTTMADLLAPISRGNKVDDPLFRKLVSKRAVDFGRLAQRIVADAIREQGYARQAGLDLTSPGFWVVARNVASADFEMYRSVDHLFALLSIMAAEARYAADAGS